MPAGIRGTGTWGVGRDVWKCSGEVRVYSKAMWGRWGNIDFGREIQLGVSYGWVRVWGLGRSKCNKGLWSIDNSGPSGLKHPCKCNFELLAGLGLE
nr:hypothetical protein [Tanacetum cinerariifolium]